MYGRQLAYSSYAALTRRTNMCCKIFKWKITKSFYVGICELTMFVWGESWEDGKRRLCIVVRYWRKRKDSFGIARSYMEWSNEKTRLLNFAFSRNGKNSRKSRQDDSHNRLDITIDTVFFFGRHFSGMARKSFISSSSMFVAPQKHVLKLNLLSSP